MDNKSPKALVEHFSSITDPRIDRTKRHKLIDILAILSVQLSAALRAGKSSNFSARQSSIGSRPFLSCQTASLPMILFAVSLAVLILLNSDSAFLNGYAQFINSLKARL
jgi:hypothetical protein